MFDFQLSVRIDVSVYLPLSLHPPLRNGITDKYLLA